MQVIRTGQWTDKDIDQEFASGAPHGAGVTVILQHIPKGSGPRLHWHPYGETWIVIEGRISFSDGDKEVEGTAGDVVYIPPRQPHKFTVLSEGRIKMICIHEAPVMENNWLE